MPVDSKLLATIIAVAKKEAGTQARDLSLLERKVEDKLKEFHKRSPILDLPTFTVKSGSLYCTWSSGHTLDFGNIVGPQGIQGIQGVQGIQGIAGKAGTNGKDGLNGKDGYNGKDGTAGRDGIDGKQGLTGVVGARGEPGQDGKQGIPGNDGQAGERGSMGLSGNDGLDGEDGEDGVGIEKAWVNDNYHLTIRLTSGKVIDAGYVRGNPGASAGKGGRVSGYSSGGSSASSPFLVNASFNSSNELILGSSNGSSINAGAPLADGGLVSPSFTYTGGLLSRIDYAGGQFKTLAYTGSQLTSVVFTNGSEVTTKTLSYGIDGSLSSIAQT